MQGTHKGHPYGGGDTPPARGMDLRQAHLRPDYSGMIRHRRTGSPRGWGGGLWGSYFRAALYLGTMVVYSWLAVFRWSMRCFLRGRTVAGTPATKE